MSIFPKLIIHSEQSQSNPNNFTCMFLWECKRSVIAKTYQKVEQGGRVFLYWKSKLKFFKAIVIDYGIDTGIDK